jgi:ubiquinone/menaquinone biosynthesis C-methylase UbiE
MKKIISREIFSLLTKSILNKYKKKIIKKNIFLYYLRIFKILFYEFIFFLEYKIFKRNNYSQSQQRKISYNKHWLNFNNISYFKKPYCWYIFNNEYFLAPAGLTHDIFISLIKSEILKLKPRNVLEVGCGIGLNIFYLAKIFKDIKFTGIDISDHAINKNNLFLKKNNINNVKFYCKNAKKLSFKQNTFDLTYTVLALEQMNQIKFKVIREIKSVTKKRIIFIEPFSDINKNLINSFHCKISDYFNLHYNELENFDLLIERKFENFPQRLGLAAGFVSLIKKKQNNYSL